MNTLSFCPVCGSDAVKQVYKSSVIRTKGLVVTSERHLATEVVTCNGCGARVSYYRDGAIVIWKIGRAFASVPKGTLMVDKGIEL